MTNGRFLQRILKRITAAGIVISMLGPAIAKTKPLSEGIIESNINNEGVNNIGVFMARAAQKRKTKNSTVGTQFKKISEWTEKELTSEGDIGKRRELRTLIDLSGGVHDLGKKLVKRYSEVTGKRVDAGDLGKWAEEQLKEKNIKAIGRFAGLKTYNRAWKGEHIKKMKKWIETNREKLGEKYEKMKRFLAEKNRFGFYLALLAYNAENTKMLYSKIKISAEKLKKTPARFVQETQLETLRDMLLNHKNSLMEEKENNEDREGSKKLIKYVKEKKQEVKKILKQDPVGNKVEDVILRGSNKARRALLLYIGMKKAQKEGKVMGKELQSEYAEVLKSDPLERIKEKLKGKVDGQILSKAFKDQKFKEEVYKWYQGATSALYGGEAYGIMQDSEYVRREYGVDLFKVVKEEFAKELVDQVNLFLGKGRNMRELTGYGNDLGILNTILEDRQLMKVGGDGKLQEIFPTELTEKKKKIASAYLAYLAGIDEKLAGAIYLEKNKGAEKGKRNILQAYHDLLDMSRQIDSQLRTGKKEEEKIGMVTETETARYDTITTEKLITLIAHGAYAVDLPVIADAIKSMSARGLDYSTQKLAIENMHRVLSYNPALLREYIFKVHTPIVHKGNTTRDVKTGLKAFNEMFRSSSSYVLPPQLKPSSTYRYIRIFRKIEANINNASTDTSIEDVMKEIAEEDLLGEALDDLTGRVKHTPFSEIETAFRNISTYQPMIFRPFVFSGTNYFAFRDTSATFELGRFVMEYTPEIVNQRIYSKLQIVPSMPALAGVRSATALLSGNVLAQAVYSAFMQVKRDYAESLWLTDLSAGGMGGNLSRMPGGFGGSAMIEGLGPYGASAFAGVEVKGEPGLEGEEGRGYALGAENIIQTYSIDRVAGEEYYRWAPSEDYTRDVLEGLISKGLVGAVSKGEEKLYIIAEIEARKSGEEKWDTERLNVHTYNRDEYGNLIEVQLRQEDYTSIRNFLAARAYIPHPKGFGGALIGKTGLYTDEEYRKEIGLKETFDGGGFVAFGLNYDDAKVMFPGAAYLYHEEGVATTETGFGERSIEEEHGVAARIKAGDIKVIVGATQASPKIEKAKEMLENKNKEYRKLLVKRKELEEKLGEARSREVGTEEEKLNSELKKLNNKIKKMEIKEIGNVWTGRVRIQYIKPSVMWGGMIGGGTLGMSEWTAFGELEHLTSGRVYAKGILGTESGANLLSKFYGSTLMTPEFYTLLKGVVNKKQGASEAFLKTREGVEWTSALIYSQLLEGLGEKTDEIEISEKNKFMLALYGISKYGDFHATGSLTSTPLWSLMDEYTTRRYIMSETERTNMSSAIEDAARKTYWNGNFQLAYDNDVYVAGEIKSERIEERIAEQEFRGEARVGVGEGYFLHTGAVYRVFDNGDGHHYLVGGGLGKESSFKGGLYYIGEKRGEEDVKRGALVEAVVALNEKERRLLNVAAGLMEEPTEIKKGRILGGAGQAEAVYSQPDFYLGATINNLYVSKTRRVITYSMPVGVYLGAGWTGFVEPMYFREKESKFGGQVGVTYKKKETEAGLAVGPKVPDVLRPDLASTSERRWNGLGWAFYFYAKKRWGIY